MINLTQRLKSNRNNVLMAIYLQHVIIVLNYLYGWRCTVSTSVSYRSKYFSLQDVAMVTSWGRNSCPYYNHPGYYQSIVGMEIYRMFLCLLWHALNGILFFFYGIISIFLSIIWRNYLFFFDYLLLDLNSHFSFYC